LQKNADIQTQLDKLRETERQLLVELNERKEDYNRVCKRCSFLV